MENLTDSLVSTFLNSLDPNPVNPTKEQRYLSFLICKNLFDLCDTGRAIVNNIESKGHPIESLPDRSNLALIQQILTKFYSDNMFIPDDEFGNRPNWSVVENFDRQRGHTAFRIYKAIHRNVVESPGGMEIQNAIKKKDRKFFLENFDKIFANIPFKEGLLKFKNFVASPYALTEDQEYVWDFFESLLDIFIYEKDNLEDLRNVFLLYLMWLLPPVVGEINNNYVVILYEFANKQSTHQVHFQSKDHEVIHFLTPNLEGPSRLEISLLPDRQYTAIWNSSYTHIVNTNIPSKFIFLSCDLPEADINPSLWERISESILEEPTLIVHLGDQIYGDLQFKKVKESLKKEYKSINTLSEIYRKRYRQTWSRLSPVLSNSSNLMIWDDHEITNDFSFFSPKNYLEESAANIALEVYNEYQKSLNLDSDKNSIDWVKLYGDIIIISMERTSAFPSLDQLRANLSRYPNVTKFILASAGSILPGDGDKFFTLSFVIELYEIVFNWLKENNQRKALLVGGDLHLGCLAQITNGTNSFFVASASPISNQPTPDRFFLANELSQSRHISDTITYNPIESRACRCYLQVHKDNFEPTMVWADQYLTSHPLKYVKTLFSFA